MTKDLWMEMATGYEAGVKEYLDHWRAHRGSVDLAFADGWYQELSPHFYSNARFRKKEAAEMERKTMEWSGYSI